MSDENVHSAGYTPDGIKGGSVGSEIMSNEARNHGGGVPSGGSTSTLQHMGAKSSTHSSGFTSSGISGGSKASGMMSQEAQSHGGGTPKGGTTATVQSVSMGGKGSKK
ncbi:interferon alpha-inducible protein 27-like protein 2B [Emydura macquarii macquarii]|uniref:interferon alpha-inducible protein 27-like protein 2B n=1 Tax=Emydura macquarii macquarii TaxID=1129001 RepID=UPI00352BC343